jgi:hypothetical protein
MIECIVPKKIQLNPDPEKKKPMAMDKATSGNLKKL